MMSAPAATAETLANRMKVEFPGRETRALIARTMPVPITIKKKIAAECFVARANPRAVEHTVMSFQAQLWNARIAKTTAVADNRETGRSVITTGKCAATVGSMARNNEVPIATPEPNTRRTAN